MRNNLLQFFAVGKLSQCQIVLIFVSFQKISQSFDILSQKKVQFTCTVVDLSHLLNIHLFYQRTPCLSKRKFNNILKKLVPITIRVTTERESAKIIDQQEYGRKHISCNRVFETRIATGSQDMFSRKKIKRN